MADLNVASQQTPFEFNALVEFLSGVGYETFVLEQHDIPPGPLSWFYIKERPLSLLFQRHSLTGNPTSGNGHETDQYIGGISTHDDPWIPAQDLLRFLGPDAFTEQPLIASGSETPSEQNGTPSVEYMVPAAALYRFIQRCALMTPSGNGDEIPGEQNGTPNYAPLLLIQAGSFKQFLQAHKIPVSLLSGDGNETPAEHQLDDDDSEDDSMSVSITSSQTQDTDDQDDAQPHEATGSISYGCPVCRDTFDRSQERNRHVESYLPHTIFCPFQGCTWTGRRQWDFKKQHWNRKHSEARPAPGVGASEIYDPKDFVKLIVDGTPAGMVARYAFAKVQENLGRLGRSDLGAGVLGRSRELKKWIRISSPQLKFDTDL